MVWALAHMRRLRTKMKMIMVVGGAMIFVALAADWIGLSAPGFGEIQFMLLSAGICILLITFLSRVRDTQNLGSLGHRIADAYKAVAILTLNTLVLFACLEIAAISALKTWSVSSRPAEQQAAPTLELSDYAFQDWVAQHQREFALSAKQQYYPYVGWRRAPFSGTTININRDGIRLTPGADCNANSYKVFVFGGSAMWGTGSPDWGTIPAYLQSGLKALTAVPVCVVNFGESAFVSTQSVIQLLMLLQSENVPELVLFYDGANDVYAAYQAGRAGVHHNLDGIISRLGAERSDERKAPRLVLEWLETSYSWSFFKSLGAKLRPQTRPKLVTYETMGIDTATLANSVAKMYLSNYKIVSTLAPKYGFKYFFFWQPVISIGEKPLTSEEEDIRLKMDDPALTRLYDSVYSIVERVTSESDYENLYYMARIFDEYNSQIWLDPFHVTPVGNQLIAQKMLDVVMRDPSGLWRVRPKPAE